MVCRETAERHYRMETRTLSLTDSRYQQKMCPWGKGNALDRLGMEIYKAGILFHGSSLASLPL